MAAALLDEAAADGYPPALGLLPPKKPLMPVRRKACLRKWRIGCGGGCAAGVALSSSSARCAGVADGAPPRVAAAEAAAAVVGAGGSEVATWSPRGRPLVRRVSKPRVLRHTAAERARGGDYLKNVVNER